MRELTPWEAEGGVEISLDDGDKASVSIWSLSSNKRFKQTFTEET